MIDTVIVSGGDIQSDFALDFLKKLTEKTGREKLTLIAADKGLEFFMKENLVPDLAVGDFDSLSEEGKVFLKLHEQTENAAKDKNSRAEKIKILRLKPEKDDSDTQSALRTAAEQGAKAILILGATGGRIDHLMANLGLMALGQKMGIRVSIMDICNYITLIPNRTVLRREEQFGKYVSFFGMGGDVKGLTLEGFKYPLHNYDLTPADSGLTVSNEILEAEAVVTYESGNLMMIQSCDANFQSGKTCASEPIMIK